MSHSITIALPPTDRGRRSLRLVGPAGAGAGWSWWIVIEPRPGMQAERGPYASSLDAIEALACMEKESKP